MKYLNTCYNHIFFIVFKTNIWLWEPRGQFLSFVFLTLAPEGRDAGKSTQCWQPVEWLVTKEDMSQILYEIYNIKFSREIKKS